MTRRDIIIIATLVNAGLLAALFMLAVNSDDDKPLDPMEINQTVTEIQPQAPQEVEIMTSTPTSVDISKPVDTSSGSHDEVDDALKELAASTPVQTIILDDEGADEELDEEAPQPEEKSIQKEKIAKPSKTESLKESVSSSEKSEKHVEIKVKRGDSLDKIARANGTTIAALKEANQLKNDKLKIGQTLRVPLGSTTSKEKKKKSSSENTVTQADAQYHTVKSGDNPWKIAKQYHIKLDDLLKLNNIDEEKARNLKIGDKVRVK